MKRLVCSVSILAAILLSGCEENETVSQNLRSIDAEIKPQSIQLPKDTGVKIVSYSGENYRSPFVTNSYYLDIVNAGGQVAYINENRNKQPLEYFELDSLQMMGIFKKGNVISALIKAPDKQIVIVGVGNYLGENNGRITKIDTSGLRIEEAISDGKGGLIKRQRFIVNINQPLS